jgi:hypothetical protein
MVAYVGVKFKMFGEKPQQKTGGDFSMGSLPYQKQYQKKS